MNESELLNKIKSNYKLNYFWLKLLNKPIARWLAQHKVPPQTIGIFLNPYTSNRERIGILKRFVCGVLND